MKTQQTPPPDDAKPATPNADGNALLTPGESETAGTDSSPNENLSSDERAELLRAARSGVIENSR